MLPTPERSRLRPCLRCGRMRMSTRVNRLHPGNCEGAIAFNPEEHRRIDRWLAKNEPTPPKAKPGPKPDPTRAWRGSLHLPGTPKPKRERTLMPFPTEAQVAQMTPPQKSELRQRYKKRGVPLPAYLTPLTPYQAGVLGGFAKTAAKATA